MTLTQWTIFWDYFREGRGWTDQYTKQYKNKIIYIVFTRPPFKDSGVRLVRLDYENTVEIYLILNEISYSLMTGQEYNNILHELYDQK
jgi:hypothetical protein